MANTIQSMEGPLFSVPGTGLKSAAGALPAVALVGKAVLISGDVTITATNADDYNGNTLEWTTAAVVTLSASLPADFGFAGIPPASGNASIASAGGTLLNGATDTITRAAASNTMFAVVARVSAADSYVATGS